MPGLERTAADARGIPQSCHYDAIASLLFRFTSNWRRRQRYCTIIDGAARWIA